MNNKQLLITGITIWLVPFALSFLFYSPQSELLINYTLFKAIMLTSLVLVTWFMFQRYYKIIGKTTRTLGITAGAVVLLINLLFDYIFLIVFLSAFTVIEYVLEIGISYIVIIPLINWLIGRRHLK